MGFRGFWDVAPEKRNLYLILTGAGFVKLIEVKLWIRNRPGLSCYDFVVIWFDIPGSFQPLMVLWPGFT